MPSAVLLPPVSALSSCIQSQPASLFHSAHHSNLALQIQHNLQHQHDWTLLRVHTHSPLTQKPLSQPLISGLPPHRIYVHPDDQIEELKSGLDDGKLEVEREWVLPTHLRERWTLRRFAEVFDSIEEEPLAEEHGSQGSPPRILDAADVKSSKKRRGGKRVLLATLGDDSTVVYYIMHDGIVKPRQN